MFKMFISEILEKIEEAAYEYEKFIMDALNVH